MMMDFSCHDRKSPNVIRSTEPVKLAIKGKTRDKLWMRFITTTTMRHPFFGYFIIKYVIEVDDIIESCRIDMKCLFLPDHQD